MLAGDVHPHEQSLLLCGGSLEPQAKHAGRWPYVSRPISATSQMRRIGELLTSIRNIVFSPAYVAEVSVSSLPRVDANQRCIAIHLMLLPSYQHVGSGLCLPRQAQRCLHLRQRFRWMPYTSVGNLGNRMPL